MLITGHFRDFITFTIIIIIHELGHIVGGIIFNWKINQIILLPFGAITIFKTLINTKIKEQLIISILGPLFQIIFFLIIKQFTNLSPKIIYYNYALLIFNLLPIYPLDGSKILNSTLNLILPFKTSHIISNIISVLILLLMFLNIQSLIVLLTIIFLSIKVIKEIYNHKYILNKFLYERYNYDINFKKEKTVSNINKMYLNCRHIFFIENKYYTEKKLLSIMFDNQYKLW